MNNLILADNAIRILKHIASVPHKTPLAIADIARQTGLSEKTVDRHLKMLRALDYLSSKRPGRGHKCHFELAGKVYIAIYGR